MVVGEAPVLDGMTHLGQVGIVPVDAPAFGSLRCDGRQEGRLEGEVGRRGEKPQAEKAAGRVEGGGVGEGHEVEAGERFAVRLGRGVVGYPAVQVAAALEVGGDAGLVPGFAVSERQVPGDHVDLWRDEFGVGQQGRAVEEILGEVYVPVAVGVGERSALCRVGKLRGGEDERAPLVVGQRAGG